jgi:hypothetical protein
LAPKANADLAAKSEVKTGPEAEIEPKTEPAPESAA